MQHAVIMAGGSGTRFWPLSRRAVPKQFLKLTGQRSLIQLAYDRVAAAEHLIPGGGASSSGDGGPGDEPERVSQFIPPERVWIVTNVDQVKQTQRHLPNVSPSRIVQEPCGRNTAPCIGLAALCLTRIDPEATMLVMPADHVIEPVAAFQETVREAFELVESDPQRLVLFGVPPTSPATGFGYIERGEPFARQNAEAVAPERTSEGASVPAASSLMFDVASFREKPDRATAETYLRAGTFYWNSGIFVWKASRILEALREHEPEIGDLLEHLRPHLGKPDWEETLRDVFPRMKSVSIDYAVLERDREITVLEAPFHWDDVGSWEAISRYTVPDAEGNFVVGKHCGLDSSGCIIHSCSEHLVTTIGMQNVIVVQTPDATLVADRRDQESIRQLVALLEERGYEKFL
jgi:mannose-1-phosphate guanylyltransferase